MSDFEHKDIPLPEKKEGENKDIQTSLHLGSMEEAWLVFDQAKRRLLDVNNWSRLCGAGSAQFMLTDAKGLDTAGPPIPGFHIRINVPGPGSKAGDGYDWVEVEAVKESMQDQEDREFIIMRVRPCHNPLTAGSAVAHFFSDKATSNFLVMREGKKVTAAVLGRNEMVNTKSSSSLIDRMRHALVGIAAALGLSNPQWQRLVKGLLDKN